MMSNQPPHYSFLAESETVIHALETKDTTFVVTDRRFARARNGEATQSLARAPALYMRNL